MTIEHMTVGPKGIGIGIVAFGATKTQVDWDSPDWTYWSMNDSYHFFARKLSRLYEMHQISHYTDPKHYIADHEERMAAFRASVVLAIPNPKLPNAQLYPLDKVIARFGRRYFTSTITYMIPHAIMTIEKSLHDGDGIYAPRIGLWGCDMQLTSEYAKERACTEYWLGRAEGCGIEVTVVEDSPILKAGYLYGYDMPTISDRQRIIDARRRDLTEILKQALEQDRIANDRVSAVQGMLSEAAYYEVNLTDAPAIGRTFE